MSENKLDKIEEILKSLASTTEEHSDRIKELQATVSEMQIRMSENHSELRLKSDLRHLEGQIRRSHDDVENLLGRQITSILLRLSKLEDKAK